MGAELGRLHAQMSRTQAQAIAQEAVSTMFNESKKTISIGISAAIAATTVSGMLLYTVAGGNFRDSLKFIPYYIGIGAISGGATLGAVAWVNKNQVIAPSQPQPSQPKVEVQQAPQRDRELEKQMAVIARTLIDMQERLDNIETQPTPEPEPTGLETLEQAHAETVDSAEISAAVEAMKGRDYTYYPSVI